MEFSHSRTSFFFVIVIMLTTLDNTSAKPTNSLHHNLKYPCGKGNDLGLKVDELGDWNNMHMLARMINNAVKEIRMHQDLLPCKNAPSLQMEKLNKLTDFSQIKDIREATKAAYSDLMNAVAHFNVIVDVEKCWHEKLENQIETLRQKMMPVLCSINGILEADAEELLNEVIALKIIASNQECSYHSTVTCTLLDHVQDLANALMKYNVPS